MQVGLLRSHGRLLRPISACDRMKLQTFFDAAHLLICCEPRWAGRDMPVGLLIVRQRTSLLGSLKGHIRMRVHPCLLKSSVGRVAICALIGLLPNVTGQRPLLALVASQADVSNRFPEVGSLVVWGRPNTEGRPEGMLGNCSGVLIHERVFLTAGHCTGLGVPGIPPFVEVAVSFNPANAFDRTTWIPVQRQLIHPSLPASCQVPPGCDPTTTKEFSALDPTKADLGLVVLSRPVQNIRPAVFATPGFLTRSDATTRATTVVGYGSMAPPPSGIIPAALRLRLWDGVRRLHESNLDRVVNGNWATWTLPGRVCAGDSGAPTFQDEPVGGQITRRLVAVVSDGGMDCSSRDARTRVDTAAAQDWINGVIRQEVSGLARP